MSSSIPWMQMEELPGATPENIDAHIEYARRGGFRTMMVYYVDFARSCGHYGWREEYPLLAAAVDARLDDDEAAYLERG